MAIEKIKILGVAVLELPAKQENRTANPDHQPQNWAKLA